MQTKIASSTQSGKAAKSRYTDYCTMVYIVCLCYTSVSVRTVKGDAVDVHCVIHILLHPFRGCNV